MLDLRRWLGRCNIYGRYSLAIHCDYKFLPLLLSPVPSEFTEEQRPTRNQPMRKTGWTFLDFEMMFAQSIPTSKASRRNEKSSRLNSRSQFDWTREFKSIGFKSMRLKSRSIRFCCEVKRIKFHVRTIRSSQPETPNHRVSLEQDLL